MSLNAHRLIGLAERLQPLVSTEVLHKLWQKLPNQIRSPLATERGVSAPAPKFAEARNAQLKAFVNQCDLRLAPSRYLAERAMRNGIDETKHLPHGIDDRYEHVGGRGILFLGTLSFHKGADLVAQAISEAFPDGSIQSNFYGLPVDPGLAAEVNAKPPLERAQVWQALRHADVLVMGSRWRENSPLVILEAKAAGCPVIAPRIGGIPELITEGRDGFLYTPGSVEDCANALKKWRNSPKLIPSPPPSATERADKLEVIYQGLLRQ
jgi:glycosyltransferase involved in cell wall biosynthesis